MSARAEITNEEIDDIRIAGEITLILKNGEPWEKQSFLNVVEKLCGIDERLRLERWVGEGMPGA